MIYLRPRMAVVEQTARVIAHRPAGQCSRHIPRDNAPKAATMSIGKKIAHRAEAMKGGAKKTTGRATGSRRLQAEGRGDQVKGNLKQAGQKIKDAFKH
ncbi:MULTISPECIES: CsbD family protein [Streptomyces]|uniref:CsbD family protein n=2 Tax=Streptomyces achromogenes TaxID=67255 RepID=UPI00055F8D28